MALWVGSGEVRELRVGTAASGRAYYGSVSMWQDTTPNPDPDPGTGTIAEAAQLILDRFNSGLTILEDWTWTGAPAIVGQFNDDLLLLFTQVNGGYTFPGDIPAIKVWLQQYVTPNPDPGPDPNPNPGPARTPGPGGVPRPSPASHVVLASGNSTSSLLINQSGTSSQYRIYDGGGFTVGPISVRANYVIVQNYRVKANADLGISVRAHHAIVQHCDVKDVRRPGDLNAMEVFGDDISVLYNTCENFITGDAGGSHTDGIQTWNQRGNESTSRLIVQGNRFTGAPSEGPGTHIHQALIGEGKDSTDGGGGGTGVSGDWFIADNYWTADCKFDDIQNVTYTRNTMAGNDKRAVVVTSYSKNFKYYSDNKVTGSLSVGVGATVIPGPGPLVAPWLGGVPGGGGTGGGGTGGGGTGGGGTGGGGTTVAPYRRGVNLSGGEYGATGSDGETASAPGGLSYTNPGTYGSAYVYPQAGDFDYLKTRMPTQPIARLMVRIERLTTAPGSALRAAEIPRITAVLDAAAAAGVGVIIAPWNFGAVWVASGGNAVRTPIGSAGFTTAQFANFWSRVVSEWGDHPALAGVDLVNEPVAVTGGASGWQAAAQAAVTAIRLISPNMFVWVPTYGYSLHGVASSHPGGPWIVDTAARFGYTSHHYAWNLGGSETNYATTLANAQSQGHTASGNVDALHTRELAAVAAYRAWAGTRPVFVGEWGPPNPANSGVSGGDAPKWATLWERLVAQYDIYNWWAAAWTSGGVLNGAETYVTYYSSLGYGQVLNSATGSAALVQAHPSLGSTTGGGGSSGTASLTHRVVGIPSTTAVPMSVRVSGASSVRLQVSTSSAFTSGVISGPVGVPNAQGDAQLTVSGLTANTAYYHRVGVTSGGTERFTAVSSKPFRTAPTGQANFAFCFASCDETTNSSAMSAIAARGDAFFLHMGDLYYNDAASSSVAQFRTEMVKKIQASNYRAVFDTTPMSYTPSDHDGMADNGTFGTDAAGWTNWNQVHRELFPMLSRPGGSMGVYATWTWGRVRFIQLDTRSFASSPSASDNSSKTFLGATQKQWLKDQITAATEPVIVLVQDTVWIGGANSGDPTWQGYVTERTELANFFVASGKNICMLGGDMHAVAANSGASSPGGIAMFHGAPLSNDVSHKGSPYTVGPSPGTGGKAQQYGRIVVTDTGTQISLAYTGNNTNSQLISLTKTYTL